MLISSNIKHSLIVNEKKLNASIFKIIFLAFLGIISFISFGYFLKSLIINQNFNSVLILALSIIIFWSVFIIQSFFIKNNWISYLIIFLECLGLIGVFYKNIFNGGIQIGIGITFLILILANQKGRRELEDFVKIRFWRISKTILPKAIAAVFLFSSIIYIYGFPAEGGFFMSKQVFEKILLPNKVLIDRFYPEFDFSLTLNEFVKKSVEQEISGSAQFKNLPALAKSQLIAQSIKEFEGKISKMAGVKIDSKLKISDAIYEALKNKFLNLPENIKPYVPIFFVLFIFLILEGFAIPARWIASIFSFIIYEIFLALGFAKIELEGGSREIITL